MQVLLFFVYPFGGTVKHCFCSKYPDGHFGQFMLYSTKIGYRLLKLLAGSSILNACVQCALSTAQCSCTKLEAANVHDIEGNNMASAYFAQQVACGHHTFFKKHLAGPRSFDTHFMFLFAKAEP